VSPLDAVRNGTLLAFLATLPPLTRPLANAAEHSSSDCCKILARSYGPATDARLLAQRGLKNETISWKGWCEAPDLAGLREP